MVEQAAANFPRVANTSNCAIPRGVVPAHRPRASLHYVPEPRATPPPPSLQDHSPSIHSPQIHTRTHHVRPGLPARWCTTPVCAPRRRAGAPRRSSCGTPSPTPGRRSSNSPSPPQAPRALLLTPIVPFQTKHTYVLFYLFIFMFSYYPARTRISP